MAKTVSASAKSERIKIKCYRVLVLGVLLMVMGGALSIPFVYETQTLWYKVGGDKLMLRTGQIAGLAAVVLLFVQILLAARGKFLQHLFGVAALMRWHRVNGIIVSLLAICHMLLILLPEGLTNLPIGKKHWPAMVGMLLLCIIVGVVTSAQWRKQLPVNYRQWRAFHKFSGYLILALAVLHVLFVSESFAQTVPRIALFLTLFGVVLAVAVGKIALRPPKS